MSLSNKQYLGKQYLGKQPLGKQPLGKQPLGKQHGLGLIEVLVAMLLLSIGAVGLASMQIKAKRMTFEAVQRSVATSLTRDIIERMRHNPTALDSYVRNNLGNGSIGAEPTPNCSTSSCTITQLAAHDLWEWESALDGATETVTEGTETSLVGGLNLPRACITHSAGVVSVAVVWKGYEDASNPAGLTTCGEGLGLYGADDNARQVIFISTFVDEI